MSWRPEQFDWKREIKASSLAAIWLTLLTGPLVVFKINTSDYSITLRWSLLLEVAAGAFVLSAVWRWLLARRDSARRAAQSENANHPREGSRGPARTWVDVVMGARYRFQIVALAILGIMSIPFWASPYVVHVCITALIYIALGLGLNIVVGVSGLLNLGYVAFYAIGAYTYALLNHHFGLGFWVCLPLGALTATALGLLLGFPILRLRGDYLAIATLGFGEIVRLVLVNSELTRGPRGIGNISPPAFFGLDLNSQIKPFLIKTLPFMSPGLDLNKALIFFIILALVILTIIAVFRLENSRLGRAWLALREDEVACQAMGINRTMAKLTAFALGATWAGLAGVVFAAQVTFINPTSFGFMQSVMILSIVVLGGMGSIPGVIIGALVLILLPEYLRSYENYRMLLFGALMVLMMVLRPGGLIQSVRQVYIHRPAASGAEKSKTAEQ
jgi:branched-chain amino acid transport system permease protein